MNRVIDPLNEVTVSVGATEAIYAIMQAMINEGDEVVILEPAFDMWEETAYFLPTAIIYDPFVQLPSYSANGRR